jgi:uncharacterized protein YcnI
MKVWSAAITVVAFTASVSAHIMVSPPQAKAGSVQRYELRVHNEGKLAVAAVELEIPAGIMVTAVEPAAGATYTMTKSGNRISAIKWEVSVPSTKYVALPFTATNPATATEVHWNVHERLADGSIVEWSDQPNAAEKASVTKIG